MINDSIEAEIIAWQDLMSTIKKSRPIITVLKSLSALWVETLIFLQNDFLSYLAMWLGKQRSIDIDKDCGARDDVNWNLGKNSDETIKS